MTDLRAALAASAALPALREQPLADPAIPRMELVEWAERYGVVAGITTRGHGFSLGLWSEENVGQVMSRWRAITWPTFSSLHKRSEEHTSELQSRSDLVCRLLLEKKKTLHEMWTGLLLLRLPPSIY